MEHVQNVFMSFDKYLFLEMSFRLVYLNNLKYIVQNISEAYLRTETFDHIGFETKQEMTPYYHIVHKTFQVAILRNLRRFLSRWSHPCE